MAASRGHCGVGLTVGNRLGGLPGVSDDTGVPETTAPAGRLWASPGLSQTPVPWLRLVACSAQQPLWEGPTGPVGLSSSTK